MLMIESTMKKVHKPVHSSWTLIRLHIDLILLYRATRYSDGKVIGAQKDRPPFDTVIRTPRAVELGAGAGKSEKISLRFAFKES